MKYTLLTTAAVVGLGVAAGLTWERWPRPSDFAVFGGSTPSVMGAYKDSSPAPPAAEPTVAIAPKATAVPQSPVLHPKAAEYAHLTAKGATPAMLSAAFELVLSCQREANALAGGVQTHPLSEERCQLPPGEPQAVTMKRMLEARVRRADFGAYQDVQRQGTGVYADDPAAWKALMKEAREVGLKRGEPLVMLVEAMTQLDRGEALQSMGMLDEAQAAYRLALRYQVAHELGMAKANGLPPNLSTPKVLAVSSHIASQAARDTAIEEGRKLALNWRTES